MNKNIIVFNILEDLIEVYSIIFNKENIDIKLKAILRFDIENNIFINKEKIKEVLHNNKLKYLKTIVLLGREHITIEIINTNKINKRNIKRIVKMKTLDYVENENIQYKLGKDGNLIIYRVSKEVSQDLKLFIKEIGLKPRILIYRSDFLYKLKNISHSRLAIIEVGKFKTCFDYGGQEGLLLTKEFHLGYEYIFKLKDNDNFLEELTINNIFGPIINFILDKELVINKLLIYAINLDGLEDRILLFFKDSLNILDIKVNSSFNPLNDDNLFIESSYKLNINKRS